MKKGKLIIFEGTDYSGKSTCIKNVISKLNKENIKFIDTIEPGSKIQGSDNANLCNEIRRELLSEKLPPKSEALLFAMSRYYHTLDIIKYLDNGYHVICDRYFISSLAYQSPNIGLYNVFDYNKASLELLKDYEVHNIILTLDYDTYIKRSTYREQDAMEKVSKDIVMLRINNMKKIGVALVELGMNKWIKGLSFVDATQSKEKVFENVEKIINKIVK